MARVCQSSQYHVHLPRVNLLFCPGLPAGEAAPVHLQAVSVQAERGPGREDLGARQLPSLQRLAVHLQREAGGGAGTGLCRGDGVFGWDVGRESSEGTTHKPERRLHSGCDWWGRSGTWRGRRQQEGPRAHVALACVLGVITP